MMKKVQPERTDRLVFALAGNQNCGKTTLFNQLTGSNQHVGNWPGVTVEKKEGYIKTNKNALVVDLPGIYSLSPYTMEEVVTRNFILEEHPDAVINVLDATNLERNLYLSLQLAELGVPMVIALNMMDEVEHEGDKIDIKGLERELGIPIVPIAAAKNRGIGDLVKTALSVAQKKLLPKANDICDGEVHKALHAIAHLVEDKAIKCGYSPRFAATKLIEGDEPVYRSLNLDERDEHIIEEVISHMEEHCELDREAVLPDTRYQFISGLVSRFVVRSRDGGGHTLTQKIDSVLTNKYLAIPSFILMMFLTFFIAFGPVGNLINGWFETLIDSGIGALDALLHSWNVSPYLNSLLIDGVFAGVGSVLTILPTILLLFLCLSVLEDSGYMARAAFVMDKPLRKIGLSGRSFIPLIIGFGCTVPAIMATRTLENQRDRRLTIMLSPFMSCGAKVPVYALFTAAFFPENPVLIMCALYLMGILVAVLSGLILKKFVYHEDAAPFVMELPPYRFPTLKSVMLHMWDKAKEFVKRAFTVILAASVVVWLLQSMNTSFQYIGTEQPDGSILAAIGSFIAPVFMPLGFGTYQAVTSLAVGIMAKESIISTMAVLYGVGATAAASVFHSTLNAVFTPLTAFSFLTFTLLYTPCVASLAAMGREMGSRKVTVAYLIAQLLLAWAITFIVYNGGLLLGLG